jgi:hypothetical protein
MSKIQNISMETKKVLIFLDKILMTYKYLKKSRFVSICLESLDLSRRSR